MASQDNPEKGLCQYTSILQSKASVPARLRVSTKSSLSVDVTKSVQRSARSPKASDQYFSNNVGFGKISPASFDGTLSSSQHATPRTNIDELPENEERVDLEHIRSVVRGLEQPVENDHKSFIQNLFGTVAFHMLEWLTPKNLESMVVSDLPIQNASKGKQEAKIEEPSTAQSAPPTITEDLQNIETYRVPEALSENLNTSSQRITEPESSSEPNAHIPCTVNGHAEECDVHLEEDASKETLDPSSKTFRLPHDPIDSTSQASFTKHVNGSLLNDGHVRNSLDLGLSKSERINGQIIQHEDPEHKKSIDSQGVHTAKKARKRLSSLTSSRPSVGYQESISHHGGQHSPILQSTRRTSISKVSPAVDNDDGKQAASEERPVFQVPRRKHQISTRQPALAMDLRASPQSLSILSLEVIEFISDVCHEDGMRDSNTDFAKILNTKACLRRMRRARTQNKTECPGQISFRPSPETAPMWKSFIEQSLFFVLSSSKALLETFSGEGRSLVDTQTLWYSMTRLIHTKSSIVFDSLWIAAADLYPPRELWPIYDWAKRTPIQETEGIVIHNPDEAARLMSICLHALIAAVPYTRDSTQLFTLSRIRSYGVSSVQRRGVPAELVNLYLRTDDAFSDDLILRLARRIFGAIPARRQYQDLLGPSEARNAGQSSIPDILELVLAPLNFLDIEVPPILDFTPEDREIHERRAPTLLIDWARTIMLQDWTGRAEVSADGAFGGAVAMMSAICKSQVTHLHNYWTLMTRR